MIVGHILLTYGRTLGTVSTFRDNRSLLFCKPMVEPYIVSSLNDSRPKLYKPMVEPSLLVLDSWSILYKPMIEPYTVSSFNDSRPILYKPMD